MDTNQEYCELGKHFVDEIHIDDYGLVACFDCYQNSPEAQNGMNRALANDPVELDHQE